MQGDDPRNWDQAKVEAKLKDSWELTEIALSPNSEGFTGKGKDGKGESFEITVTRDKALKKISYTAKGDRGSIFENNYELTP